MSLSATRIVFFFYLGFNLRFFLSFSFFLFFYFEGGIPWMPGYVHG